MLLPIIILGATAIYSINKTAGALEKVVEKSNKEILPVIRLQKVVLQAAMPPNDFLIDGNKSHYEKFRNFSMEIDSSFESILASDITHPEIVLQAMKEWETAQKMSYSILDLKDPMTNVDAQQQMLILDLTMDRIVDILNGIIDPNYNELGQRLRSAQEIRWKVYLIIIIVFGSGLLVAVTTGLALAMSVIYPVRVLQYGAGQIGEGNLSYRIKLDSKDELGQLAGSFNSMAEKVEISTSMLHELATHDGLTGLYNNREFYRRLRDEFNRYKRFYRSFTLLLADIDNFKEVNDKYGHPAGDTVLSMLASNIKDIIRETDFAARYGGDEFAVILCDTESNGALNLAQRLRKKIEETPIPINENRFASITISIGLATISDDIESEEKLITIADNNLYKAKNAGRNRIIAAQSDKIN
ncbi:MAG: diguanylate cyclase [Deltaproteobacteria bacterium]|nr:diguanylate cyclase [Deltaproteobacteria bacterium]